ncbi:hypothetical protein [Thermomonospora cellulosilytica]|uniref:Uncharacterized protein n=1 Tax=Thermomonospora cellulosilytica TaxID=1411118 RepID=A0A7W3MUM5_9ACTN|nr:hypothetical protein [Thermomonospora cellulosilytica]MBA9002200.1 hypothetical protein [Thermomonospora cellulosilytica]
MAVQEVTADLDRPSGHTFYDDSQYRPAVPDHHPAAQAPPRNEHRIQSS